MKKVVALLCVSLLVTSGILSGCGDTSANKEQTASKSESASTAGSTSNAGSAESEKTEEKTVDSTKFGNGEKLVVALQTNSTVEDYEDNYFTKKLESDLDIDIEFVLMPSDKTEFQTKVSLMAAGGEDLPDVFIGTLDKMVVDDMGANGIFLPLNEYIENEEISPNWYKISEEDRALMLSTMIAPDGNIYGLTTFTFNEWNQRPYRLYINQAWLDTLGLEMPKTTDDLYEVLKAFVNNDPNGNGKKDEIGVYGATSSGWALNVIWSMMNSFTFYNSGDQNGGLALAEDGKTVYAPYTTDGWRQGLEYMRKLCEEGLLTASVFTDDSTQFKAVLNAETNVVGVVCSGSMGNWSDANNNPNFLEMKLMAPLEGPEGIAYTPYKEYAPEFQFYVTSSCENPELAYRFGDYFKDEKISRSNYNGEYGVDWTDDPELCSLYTHVQIQAGIEDSVKCVNRYKTDIDLWSEPNSKTWHGVGPIYLGWPGVGVDRLAPYDPNNLTPDNQVYLDYYANYVTAVPDKILPVLSYTVDETDLIAMPLTDIQAYVKASAAEFITGQKALNDETWQEYLKNFDVLGLPQLLETAQTAYDRVAQ